MAEPNANTDALSTGYDAETDVQRGGTGSEEDSLPLRQSMIVANIEGLCSRRRSDKVGMLREKMVESGTLLAALTETHLNPNILDAECSIPNYHLYRADRGGNRNKGGVAMYIRSDIAGSSKLICSGSNGVVEYQMVHIRKYNVVIMNLYRPPTTKMAEFSPVLSTLKLKLNELDDHSISLIICGDFNFPRTCFYTGTTLGGSDEERRQVELLRDLQDELFLRQIVNRPSRGDSYLDLIFTNNEDIFGVVEAEDSIMTDHRVLMIQTFLETLQKPVRQEPLMASRPSISTTEPLSGRTWRWNWREGTGVESWLGETSRICSRPSREFSFQHVKDMCHEDLPPWEEMLKIEFQETGRF